MYGIRNECLIIYIMRVKKDEEAYSKSKGFEEAAKECT